MESNVTQTWMSERFEEHRSHLRSVAYRMLGSVSESEDALQEAWIRANRADASEVENVGGWLTTIVARVCLNMLRARATRREDPMDWHVPDPVVGPEGSLDPENEAVLADSVSLALLVVLDALPPPERLAFVLHDMFSVPFDEIADIVGRSETAARQLASRARRRVAGASPARDDDIARQREVVDAFFAAARNGDFDRLVAVLDPDVTLRSDRGSIGASAVIRGAEAVAGQAVMFGTPAREMRPAMVNGAAGAVVTIDGTLVAVMGFTVSHGRIVAIDALGDPERLARVDLSALDT